MGGRCSTTSSHFTQFHPRRRDGRRLRVEIVGRRGIAVDIDLPLARDAEIDGNSSELRLTFQYDASRLTDGIVAKIASRYRRSLDDMAQDPHEPWASRTVRPESSTPSVGHFYRHTPQAGPPCRRRSRPPSPRAGGSRGCRGVGGRLGRSDVGRHDNFVDLGGHSLVATQVVARLRRRLGANLLLSEFLEAPTVAGLAATIRERVNR